ncbi:MAG: type VI secretion system baseplate subunit TssE [Sterolibacteriaceae bacterium]|jgi:type VI secretion system protein ImpF|nr:type VI secretion system baseplate subunit TssE [Candidatus Methylophosphatis haderslevensis]
MAELTPLERLQPALLDRLSDDAPQVKVEAREARVITRQRFRQAVLRDLAWLFNAARPTMDATLAACEHAQHSVINYGLPSMSGELASTFDIAALEASIRQAIVDFEPRIDSATLQVDAVMTQASLDHHNQLQVQIRGSMWAQPVPIELLLRTDVDLETGQVAVHDLTR